MASIIKTSAKERKLFNFLVVFQLLILFCAFLARNLIIFYIFFESALIPIIIIIFIWGNQPERSQAGVYMLFYTLLGSLPLLAMLSFSRHTSFFVLNFILSEVCPALYTFSIFFFIRLSCKITYLFFSFMAPQSSCRGPCGGLNIISRGPFKAWFLWYFTYFAYN